MLFLLRCRCFWFYLTMPHILHQLLEFWSPFCHTICGTVKWNQKQRCCQKNSQSRVICAETKFYWFIVTWVVCVMCLRCCADTGLAWLCHCKVWDSFRSTSIPGSSTKLGKWVSDWVCDFSPGASSAMDAAKETKFATEVA